MKKALTDADNQEIRQELIELQNSWSERKNENMTLNDLYQEYMTEYAPNRLRPKSVEVYRFNLTNHILGVLGSMRLSDINNHLLSVYFCQYINSSASIAHNSYHALSSLMNYGVRMHYIRSNPCREVTLPQQHSETRRKYLTMEELPEFLSLFSQEETVDFIVRLLLFTGIRIGEACALRWSDIDFSKNVIHIERTLGKKKGGVQIGDPKSPRSRRTIAMGKCVRDLLIRQKHRTNRRNDIHPELVFKRKNGDYLHEFLIWYPFKKRLEDTQFDFMTLHCLRHTNATFLLNEGIDLKLISSHLGHSNLEVTADIYTEVLQPAQQRIAEVTDQIFLNV